MKKILIVEDSFIVSKLLKTVLSARGYEVNVHETINSARNDHNNYDLVILDYKLPDGNGTSIVKELRMRNPAIPIVLLTARGSSAVMEEAKTVGVNEFLNKPVDTSTLMSIITYYLQR